MRVFLSLLLLSLCLPACAEKESFTSLELQRLTQENVAIDGYSPVSYFQRDKAEKGSPDFAVTHEGVVYWLTDTAQVQLFQSDPEKYQPAHGGWCSLMLSGSGNRTPANPETWKIVDGQLLMFWSGDFEGTPVNGLKNWESKTHGDPKKELKRLKTANKTWDAILSGKTRKPVVLFNERDEDLIVEHHRRQMK